MKEIKLTQREVVIVDDEDFKFLNRHGWRYNGRYAIRASSRKLGKRHAIYMHREVLKRKLGLVKFPSDKITDHVNGDKLDNRRANLRLCNARQNAQNRCAFGRSKFKGVSFQGSGKPWLVLITDNGSFRYLGHYHVEELAALIYDREAEKVQGEFARLNFPEITGTKREKRIVRLVGLDVTEKEKRKLLSRTWVTSKTKLTERDVAVIKSRLLNDCYEGIGNDLAREYGVHSSTISRIRSGKAFASVKPSR